MNKELFWAG